MTSSRRIPRAPWLLSAAVTVLVAAALPAAGHPVGESPAFLPAFLSAVLVLDALSAWLLLQQYRATGRRRALVFGSAYLWCMASVLAHVLVVPGVLSPTGLLGAAPSSAPWLWTSWHTGFGLLLLLAALPLPALDAGTRPSRRTPMLLAAVVGVLSVSATWTWVVTARNASLPVIIAKGDYSRLVHTVGPWTVLANVLAVGALCLHARRAPGLERWFVPVSAASLGDVVLTLFAQSRFTAGWYAGRALALVAAAVVLLAMVAQMTRMYRQLEASTGQLRVLAETDELTGLANRRAVLAAGHALVLAAHDRGQSVCVAIVDADRFKAVNDEYGHDVGDQVLFALAGRMSAAVRAVDVLGRQGGEEFLVVLPDTDLTEALAVADRLRTSVGRSPVGTTAGPLRVNVSIGVAQVLPGQDLLSGLSRADAALYSAKAAGRDRVVAAPTALLIPGQPDRRGRRPVAHG